MRPKNSLLLVLAAAALAFAVLACNVSMAPTEEPLETPTEETAGDPTETPTVEPAGQADCALNSLLVQDVTVPDGTQFQPNTPFPKTWRVQNSGSCDWEAGSQLVYISGDAMSGPGVVGVLPMAAGASADVTVNFTSPGSPGTYTSYWQMRSPDGTLFGALLFVKIVVPGQAAVPEAEWGLYRNGDQGPVVYAIQYLLKAEGYNLGVDGKFGPQTTAAVKNFQTAKGLAADGVVGPNTWAALIQGNTVKSGSNGDAVRAAQYLLANKYGYGIAVDGVFGPATNTAVKNFQTSKGLTADGIVGPNIWKALVSGP